MGFNGINKLKDICALNTVQVHVQYMYRVL